MLRAVRVKARVFVDERGAPVDFETTDRFYSDPKDASRVTRCRSTTPLDGFQEVGDRGLPTRGRAVWHPPEGELAYADFSPDPATVAFNVAPGLAGEGGGESPPGGRDRRGRGPRSQLSTGSSTTSRSGGPRA